MYLTKVSSGMIADQPAFSAYQSSAQTFYVELYGLFVTGQDAIASASSTYFQGFLARAA